MNTMTTVAHAYSKYVGEVVGVERDGNIVAAVIQEPEFDQDHNLVTVMFADLTVTKVRYMDTYKRGFIPGLSF